MSILQNQVNSKRQGDVGVGMAIGWFWKNGGIVAPPLGDPPNYDLIVDFDDCLYRVQVKTTRYKNAAGNYVVNLRVNGGNRSGTGKTKHFDPTKVDHVFVYADDGSMYLIPSHAIETKSTISLCGKYDQYQVT